MSWTPSTPLAKAVDKAGFEYVPKSDDPESESDIIKSKMDAWQRNFGYCWGYDIGAPLLSMIIDCEPFYFDYDGKHWLIELWKGQYGLMTGAEIGVYNAEIGGIVDTIGGIAGKVIDYKIGAPMGGIVVAGYNAMIADKAHFFWCATNLERLIMQFKLFRDGQLLFQRGPERHWWLTGFRWGEFTKDPSSLTMELQIEGFPNQEMRDSFKASVEAKGYKPQTDTLRSIKFTFGLPKTQQPGTRDGAPQRQKSNEWWVNLYNESKKALGVKHNDPNFLVEDAAYGVKVAAEKTAYQVMLDFFEKWARTWHGSTRRGN